LCDILRSANEASPHPEGFLAAWYAADAHAAVRGSAGPLFREDRLASLARPEARIELFPGKLEGDLRRLLGERVSVGLAVRGDSVPSLVRSEARIEVFPGKLEDLLRMLGGLLKILAELLLPA
jgi:hypothetical protein